MYIKYLEIKYSRGTFHSLGHIYIWRVEKLSSQFVVEKKIDISDAVRKNYPIKGLRE